ncbi:pyridoxal kinase PdxY [soil metagenome]
MQKSAVIVVNSLVSRGSVGGRASVFVLERLGFPVISVPTRILAWHPGHGPATAINPDPAAFACLIGDLAGAPWLGEVGAIVTGYFGDPSQPEVAAGLVAAVRKANPAAVFLCDPIIGDGGRLFQPEATARAIGAHLLPIADIATPNRFELGWFSGREPADNSAMIAAARALGPKEVVVTSAFGALGEIANLAVTRDRVARAAHAALPSVPHGTGDLIAALYLAHRLGGRAPAEALERSAAAVLRLLRLAEKLGVDELPLAAGQEAFLAEPDGVTVSVGG